MAQLLAGWQVLVTAVTQKERDVVAEGLAQCGGELLSSVSMNNPPKLVITRSVRSPKYRAVLRVHPHTEVVTPTWLVESIKAGRLLPYDDFRVGPFYNLTVCFSGLSAARKNLLADRVGRAGGTHSPALDRKCSHLVTNSTDSEKFRFAVREGIPVVVTRWVEESLKAGWCQDEGPYRLADVHSGEGGGQTGGAALLAAPQTLMDEATMLPGPGFIAPTNTSRLPSGSEGVAPSTAAAPTAAAAPSEHPPARGPSRLLRCSTAVDAGAPSPPALQQQQAAAAAAAQAAAEHQAALEAQLEWDDDTPPFLDSVRLRLVGVGAADGQEALELVRQGAAKRFSEWRDDLSHIVVGSDLNAAEAADALDFLSSHRSCLPVTLDWLRQSVAAQQRLRPDGFLVPTSRLTQHNRRRLPVLEQLEAAGRMERSMSLSIGDASQGPGFVAAAAVAAAGAGGNGELARTQSQAVATGPLEGCYFTLAALRGSEAEARARRLVQENGGRVFTETTMQRITDKGKAFALCPPSLVAQQITQLRSACPDFKLVEDRNRFTIFWLECSLQAGGPLPVYRGAPLYQPLPYPLPLPGMQDVIVCVSGYEPEVRAAIWRTVETLGGAISPDDAMTRRTTHIILPECKGVRFEHSASFGVIPVTADWLIDTVQMGRLQSEAHYYPRQPADQPASTGGGDTVATRAAAAAEHSRGSTGPSQIGTTQLIGPAMGRQQPPATAAAVAAAAAGGQQARQQLVLPPPPAQQQQQRQQQQQDALPPGSAGGKRKMTLREKLRATQAAQAAVSAGQQQQQQQQQHGEQHGEAGNDENAGQGSNSQPGADLPQMGSKHLLGATQRLSEAPAQQQPAAPAQAAQQQRAQQLRSGLDEALASLDDGLKAQQQQQQQQLQQDEDLQSGQQQAQDLRDRQQGQRRLSGRSSGVPSMFESLFGPEPSGPEAAGSEMAAEPDLAAASSGQGAAAAAGSGGGRGSACRHEQQQQQQATKQQLGQRAGRGSGGAQRGSSRLRPGAQQQQQQQVEQPAALLEDGPAVEEEDGEAMPDDERALAVVAAAEAAAAAGSGSEPQDDVARALDRLNDKLLGGLRAEAPPRCGSQMDVVMPPPPARGRAGASKRGGAQPAESTLSNGSGGSRSRASKRPTPMDDGAASGGSSGRPPRRSGRGRAEVQEAPPHLDMSQQVGYADSYPTDAMVPLARTTRTAAIAAADKQLLKKHLVEAAAAGRPSTRRATAAAEAAAAAAAKARSADPLADLLS